MENKQEVIELLEKLSRMNLKGFYVDYVVKHAPVPKNLVLEIIGEWVKDDKLSVRYILNSPEFGSSFQKVYDKIEDIPVGDWCDESPFEDEFEIEMDLVENQYYFTEEQRIEKVAKKPEENRENGTIKQVLNISSQEFIYDSKEIREKHVSAMKKSGWTVGAKVRRIKNDVSIFNATEDDYEWFAEFNRRQPIDF